MRSDIGAKMCGLSGLRVIMDDIAASTAGDDAHRWVNLGIGNPAPLDGVIDFWHRHLRSTLDRDFAELSCNYGASRGHGALVDAVAGYFTERYGWPVEAANIMIGPGSQMLCFIAGALYAGPTGGAHRRVVLPALPDYTGYEATTMHDHLVGVPSTVLGSGPRRFTYAMDTAAVAAVEDVGIYLVSNPSNPTGRSLTAAELSAVTALAHRRDALAVVDNAYGEPFPGIAETHSVPVWDPRVLNCFSLSKAGLPGERVGIAIGAPEVVADMVAFLGNTALHAPRLAQGAIAAALGDGGRLDALISGTVQPFYTRRWALVDELLTENLPEDLRWRTYDVRRGMFCWLNIDEPWFDDQQLYALMKQRYTFVVPGSYFFPGCADTEFVEHGRRCVRISLSASEQALRDGIAQLGDAVRTMAGTHGRS